MGNNIDKWENLGFLTGVEEIYKKCISDSYEYLANKLKKDSEELGCDRIYNETIDVIAFPIVRKLIIKSKLKDVETIKLDYMLENLLPLSEDILKKKNELINYNIDSDAILVSGFVDHYVL